MGNGWIEYRKVLLGHVMRYPQEVKRAEGGEAPRECYVGDGRGCASVDLRSVRCAMCPWAYWNVGELIASPTSPGGVTT